jgi:SAM-dependent methyltransferase
MLVILTAMKVRDSGMPEQDYWESLFDIPRVLDGLGLDSRINDAIEVGCGYGTFTLPVAQRIRGTLHSFDIEPTMIAQTRARLNSANLKNVVLHQRDVIAEGFGIAPGSIDAVLLFNILHAENPVALLRSSAETLRPGGRIAVIHWRSEVPTPRGPDLSIRPRPEQVLAWAGETELLATDASPRILPPWHFGVTLRRTES